jgi:hypothetical protein
MGGKGGTFKVCDNMKQKNSCVKVSILKGWRGNVVAEQHKKSWQKSRKNSKKKGGMKKKKGIHTTKRKIKNRVRQNRNSTISDFLGHSYKLFAQFSSSSSSLESSKKSSFMGRQTNLLCF